MEKSKDSAAAAHHVAIFTALEGVVLDATTLEPGASLPVLLRLRSAGVPVVPVSTMTLRELAPVADSLGFHQAMLVECGGAIARRTGHRWTLEPFGPPADVLLELVREIELRSGASLLLYSALPEREAARLSGRRGDSLRASQEREFSEPFVIERGDPAEVERAAGAAGFAVRRCGRFLHLCRKGAHAAAFAALSAELHADVTVAVGSSLLDVELLRSADVAVIVPRSDDPEVAALVEAVPAARLAGSSGPAGWASAVAEVWAGLNRPSRRPAARAAAAPELRAGS